MSDYINSYIKRIDALDAINERREAAQSRGDDLVAYTANLDFLDVSNLPSADVVEVVRCKDCKHHEELLNNNDGNVLCWVHDIDVIVDGNGYCNYGKRKEQEHD